MNNIIISGCSFSVDDTCLDRSQSINSGNKNYISYPHYIKQNEDINVYNIARDAADNGTIARNLIMIVNELYNQGINYDDMFVIVQWSGIDRHSMYIGEDYLCGGMFYKKEYNGYSLSSQEGDEKHWEEYFSKIHTDKKALDFTITAIDKTQDFLKQKNIKYKMFCGWNLFDNKLDLEKYIDTTEFWFYEDAKGSYGLAQKWFKGKNKYGGMKEWVRDNLDEDDWTRGIHGVQGQDQHPSNKAQKKFYKRIISKLIGRKE